MTLFHGSSVPEINVLQPFASNHGKPYVYLTHSKVLATIYSHNPLPRPQGWFTYRWDNDGRLNYDEYFENQTELLYSEQCGYVYECRSELEQLDKMPWVYLSENPIQVTGCTEIPDIFKQLLEYEKAGYLIINRWSEASEKLRQHRTNITIKSLETLDTNLPHNQEYYRFIKEHFPDIQ